MSERRPTPKPDAPLSARPKPVRRGPSSSPPAPTTPVQIDVSRHAPQPNTPPAPVPAPAASATPKPTPVPAPTSTPSPGVPFDLAAFQTRLADVRSRIAAACARASRDPAEVTVIAVTKYAPVESLHACLAAGLIDLGESRVQQLTQRAVILNEQLVRTPMPVRPKWHLIGHLQRNKVKQLLPHVTAVHSLDSLRLAEEIDAQAAKLGRRIPVLLQVNCSEEPQKSGVAVGAALHLGEQVASMPNLQLAGLMTMAAHGVDEKIARFTFSRLREIFEEMKWHKIGGSAFKHLSMGMSDDFELALEEGATLLRLGS